MDRPRDVFKSAFWPPAAVPGIEYRIGQGLQKHPLARMRIVHARRLQSQFPQDTTVNHPVEIFLTLGGGFLLGGAVAAAIVAWLPAWAEFVSRQLVSWRALGALGVLIACIWKVVPAVWWPTIAIPLLGLALVAIPMMLGILLFPAETRNGNVIEKADIEPTGSTLVDRLQAPWSSLTEERPPAAVDMARCAAIAYQTPEEWQKSIPRLGFTIHERVADGSAKGVVMTLGDEAVIAFQGSDDFGDWFTNLDTELATPPADLVHRGFHKAYRSVAGQVKAALVKHDIRHVWITGHSLGGAMAVLCGLDLVREQKFAVRGVITFGQPLLLAPSFASRANQLLSNRFLRFIHQDDIVPRVIPGLRGGGSFMWFKDGELIFGGPRMRAFQASGAEAEAMTLDNEEGPEPLTAEQFEREKTRLRAGRAAASEPGSDQAQRMEALPNAADHSMTLYLAVIERRFGPADTKARQAATPLRQSAQSPIL